jgi:hypothetical protein
MSDAGSLGGRGLGVSVDHHSGLPAGDQHQLVLIAALRQPAGGESKSILLAYPQIAVQGLSGLAAKRERP